MRLVLLAALLLAGCGPVPTEDVAEYLGPEWIEPEMTTRPVWYDSIAELRAEARRRGVRPEPGRELEAFAVISRVAKRCDIHAVRPSPRYHGRSFYGHEWLHCHQGNWHG